MLSNPALLVDGLPPESFLYLMYSLPNLKELLGKPDDADTTAGRSAAGDEGHGPRLGLGPGRCCAIPHDYNGARHATARRIRPHHHARFMSEARMCRRKQPPTKQGRSAAVPA